MWGAWLNVTSYLGCKLRGDVSFNQVGRNVTTRLTRQVVAPIAFGLRAMMLASAVALESTVAFGSAVALMALVLVPMRAAVSFAIDLAPRR